MKVLRVINSLKMGGAERSIATNVPIHNSNGIEMDVLLLDNEKTDFYNGLIQKGIKVLTFSQKKSIYNPMLIRDIAKLLDKYDIIHSHLFPSLYWVALAKIFTRAKVKLIFTEHSTENKRRKIWCLKYIEQLIYKQYDTIISISDATTNNLRKYIGNKIKIVTINNGVDLRPFAKESSLKRVEMGYNDSDYILIQVASFRSAKDQETVMRALCFLPSNVHLILVGDGPLLYKNKQIAMELQLGDRVHFMGRRNDVEDLIKLSDILVMSSKYEGFGRAAVEGMAAKKPVIATDVPGLGDIVRGYGLLFNVGDSIQLAKYVEKLINDKTYYDEVSIKCYNRALTYDVNKMIEAYELEYYNVLNKNNNEID